MLTRSRAVQLAGTEFAPALELLRLFAYGTLADYKGAPAAGACLCLCRGGALTCRVRVSQLPLRRAACRRCSRRSC